MKSVFIAVCVLLFAALQAPVVLANGAKDIRDEADQYYQELNFKKAYKLYFKLAKAGDRYSQDRVSHMYAKGEGKTADMKEAYAWSYSFATSTCVTRWNPLGNLRPRLALSPLKCSRSFLPIRI